MWRVRSSNCRAHVSAPCRAPMRLSRGWRHSCVAPASAGVRVCVVARARTYQRCSGSGQVRRRCAFMRATWTGGGHPLSPRGGVLVFHVAAGALWAQPAAVSARVLVTTSRAGLQQSRGWAPPFTTVLFDHRTDVRRCSTHLFRRSMTINHTWCFSAPSNTTRNYARMHMRMVAQQHHWDRLSMWYAHIVDTLTR